MDVFGFTKDDFIPECEVGGAAISSLDWVSSHEQLGRNDPTRG